MPTPFAPTRFARSVTRRRRSALCTLALLCGGPALAQDAAEPRTADPRATLRQAEAKLGVEFKPITGERFVATITKNLATCDRIDVEVHLPAGGAAEVVAHPRIAGQRLDPRRCADRAGLQAKLAAECPGIAPLTWVVDSELPLRATCKDPAELERALLAVPALDKAVADLLPAMKPALTDEALTAKLREAGAGDEAKRTAILTELVPYLQEVTPCVTPGKATFEKISLNGRGAAFDAFRFRVPATEGEHRLLWALSCPRSTIKGWFIASVGGDAPKFVKFHRAKTYPGTPAENGTLLQQTDTPLRAGAEYVLWFQFKVETPVDLFVALSCLPFDKADRDASNVIEAALGLQPPR